MTLETATTPDFLTATQQDIDEQIAELTDDLNARLYGARYTRENVLPAIFPGITPRALPSRDAVSAEDVAYSTWLIGELQGVLQAQIAHKRMQGFTGRIGAYNYNLHITIVGAIRTELHLFQDMLQTRKPARTLSLIEALQAPIERQKNGPKLAPNLKQKAKPALKEAAANAIGAASTQ